MIGVNLSGAEFGKIGGAYGYSYIYPSASDINYYAAAGVDLVRLPVKWERLQPTAGGALDTAEMGRLTKFLADANAAGVKVVIDLHNYGTYYGDKLGSDKVPNSQFADFWKKLATAIGDNPAVMGYDLMNEPHDMGSPTVWPTAAQAAVDAIRTVDTKHSIYVEGDSWANVTNWSEKNKYLDIRDPANKIVYEAHLYFDKNMSGTYKGTYDQEGATDTTGVERLKDFTNWLAQKGAKGFIGELAVPDNDPRWLTALDNTYTAMKAAGLDSAYWGAGSWWGNYPLALRNADGTASTQLSVLTSHIATEDAQDAAATTAAAAAAAAAAATKLAPVIDPDMILTGTAGFDDLKGGSGNDKFIYSAGSDKFSGGAGIDTLDFSAQSAGGIVNLANGLISGSMGGGFVNGIENVTGGAGADIITGNANANVLIGYAGNDMMDGGAGADRMVGGTGDDYYFVDNVGDTVIEKDGEGTDTVSTTLTSYTLSTNVENLIFTSDAGATGHGNELANTITGGAGDDWLYGEAGNDPLKGGAGNDHLFGGDGFDTLDGGTGADIMAGGTGDDNYVVDNVGDQVIEKAGEGYDRVKSSVSFTLGSSVEALTLNGNADINGTGNELDNTLSGNNGGNVLKGLGGNDTIYGYGGNDTIDGGDGNDIITGGAGADKLTGGAGKDVFKFTALSDSTPTAWDTITDFVSGMDRIDLSKIDASLTSNGDQAFSFVGTSAFSKKAGELHYSMQHAADGHSFALVEGDTNGDGVADFALVLDHYATALKASDFVL